MNIVPAIIWHILLGGPSSLYMEEGGAMETRK